MIEDIKKKIEKQVGQYYILNDVLGQGNQAICKKAIKIDNYSEIFAVKILNKSDLKSDMNHQQKLKSLQQEIQAMQTVHNPNIVEIIEISQSTNYVYMFMEYCNQGNLESWMKKRGEKFSESEVIVLMKQFKSAFQEMYKKNVIHRDIKPQNILLHNGQIKIADFGFAKTVDNMDKLEPRTFLGTPLFIPIEIFKHLEYSSKCDIFSLGVTLFFLLYGQHPYYSRYQPKSYYDLLQILEKKELIIPDKPVFENKNIIPLLTKMLQIYEEDRISFPEFFNDKFFLDFEAEEQLLKSKILNETDIFNQSQYQNKLYLNSKRVQDQVIIQELSQQQEINSQIKTTQTTSQVLSQGLIEQLMSKYTQIELEKYIKQIHQHILYERNIAMFYFELIDQAWSLQAFKKIEMPEELYYEFLYVLAKFGLIQLQNLLYQLKNIETQFNVIKDKKIIQYFSTQKFYQIDIKMVLLYLFYFTENYFFKLEEDIQNQMNVFKHIYKKIQDITTQQPFKNPNFLPCFNLEIKKTDQIIIFFFNIQKEVFQYFFPNKANLPREVLMLVRYVQISKNPYSVFAKNGVMFPDFYMIYDNFKQMKKEELIKQIDANLQ